MCALILISLYTNDLLKYKKCVIKKHASKQVLSWYRKKSFIKKNLEFHKIKISYENLKVQLCKLYNNKYMITSKQITNTEIFAFIAVVVFKLLSRKILFINRKDNRNG